MNIRSTIPFGAVTLAFLVATLYYEYISEALRIPVLVGLAIITSLGVLALRPCSARPVLAVLGMFLVTLVYLSYLRREVVIASIIITTIVTAVTYTRVAKEYRRRQPT